MLLSTNVMVIIGLSSHKKPLLPLQSEAKSLHNANTRKSCCNEVGTNY